MPKGEKNSSAKKGKDTAVVVAIIGLVGTLIVGLLNSPVIIKLLERDSAALTEAPNDIQPISAPVESNQPLGDLKLVFDEDFEDKSANGFAFDLGDWEVVKDKSNYVLKGVATGPETPAAVAYFSSNDFSNGVIEFKVKFMDAGGIYLDFRLQNSGTYVFNMTPEYQNVILATNVFENGDWQFKPLTMDSVRTFTFQQDIWLNIRLEMHGADFTLTIDNNRIISASDSTFTRGQLRFTLDANSTVEIDDVKVWSYGQ